MRTFKYWGAVRFLGLASVVVLTVAVVAALIFGIINDYVDDSLGPQEAVEIQRIYVSNPVDDLILHDVVPRVRWEYKIERHLPSDMDGIGGFTPTWLIDLGNQGWEVVEYLPMQMHYVESTNEFKYNRVSILFKRQK